MITQLLEFNSIYQKELYIYRSGQSRCLHKIKLNLLRQIYLLCQSREKVQNFLQLTSIYALDLFIFIYVYIHIYIYIYTYIFITSQMHLRLRIIIMGLLLINVLGKFSDDPNQVQCRNFYSIDNMQIISFCNIVDHYCNFTQGLSPLLLNKTADEQPGDEFQYCLCIVAPLYALTLEMALFEIISQNGSIYLSSETIYLSGSNDGMYNLETPYKLTIRGNKIMLNSVYFRASSIWLESETLLRVSNSFLRNQSGLYSNCKCFGKKRQLCQGWNFTFPELIVGTEFNIQRLNNHTNYTSLKFNSVVLLGYIALEIRNTDIYYSLIGLFSYNIIIQISILSSTGLGYASDNGQGCGYFDQPLNQLLGCSGTGGSHGGFGGNSSPNPCNLVLSEPPYAVLNRPYTPGSGGGFFVRESRQASSGGGIINIQTHNLTLLNSNLIANGKSGYQGGGGGAGGSILIDFNYMKIVGINIVSAVGGSGKSSGGGGRVRIWNYMWYLGAGKMIGTSNDLLSILVSGGGECVNPSSCGLSGSIILAPCSPGNQLSWKSFLCEPCPIGKFKMYYGYSNCSDCTNKPDNSYYIGGENPSFQSSCRFECIIGFVHNSGQCVSSFQAMINNIGGINTIICFGIIVAFVISYLLVLLIQRITTKQLFWSAKQQMNKFSKKYFHIQQIPYHQFRVYLSGTNVSNDPWNITDQQRKLIINSLKPPLSHITSLLHNSFNFINRHSKYTKFQIILLKIVKFLYYPLYRLIKDIIKQSKAQKILKIVHHINMIVSDHESVGVKVYVKPNLSICCLQLFNYTRSVFDFYIESYFPVYFQLEKLMVGPQSYTLDLSDPFMKALVNQLSRRTEKNKNIELYMNQLNLLLRNTSQVLPILNHLWDINSYIPSIQAYLWQPPNHIIGIDKKWTIDSSSQLFLFFSTQNSIKNHFLYEEWLPSFYCDEIESLKYKYNLRNQLLHDIKKSNRWEIQNHLNPKMLFWILGIGSLLMIILAFIGFFLVIFIASDPQQQTQFLYVIIIYFCLLPFSDFFLAFLNFKAIIRKQHRVISYGIFFSLSLLIKHLILFIFGLLEAVKTSQVMILITLILWTLQLILTLFSMIVQMLLYPHLSLM